MKRSEEFEQGLFHGARTRIDDDTVLPPSVTGADTRNSRAYSEGNRGPHTENAFATPIPHVAWTYANTAGTSWAADPANNDPDPRYRSRVYRVAPAQDMVSEGSEISSRTGFKILEEIESEPGKQMTIHNVNWNAYKGRKGELASTYEDKNHWSYTDNLPTKEPKAPEPEDHPDQLNLFSGRTKSEHDEYERTSIAQVVGSPEMRLGRHTVSNPEQIAKDPLSRAHHFNVSAQLANRLNMSEGEYRFEAAS